MAGKTPFFMDFNVKIAGGYMGKRAPSPPPAPDPVAIANAEKTANVEAARETAKLNAINQYTPFGNVVFERDGSGIPICANHNLVAGPAIPGGSAIEYRCAVGTIGAKSGKLYCQQSVPIAGYVANRAVVAWRIDARIPVGRGYQRPDPHSRSAGFFGGCATVGRCHLFPRHEPAEPGI